MTFVVLYLPYRSPALAPVAVTILGGLISATFLDTFLSPGPFLSLGRKPLERIMAGRVAAGGQVTFAEAS